MTIIERFLALGLPADQCVVIGSGVLDALGLRPSGDIDLVVTVQLFRELQQSGKWQSKQRHGEVVLLRDDVEVWLSWGSEGKANFSTLRAEGVTIEGVTFAHPGFVLDWKKEKGRQKDLDDVQLLEEYLQQYDARQ